jgi:hypothetical protein
MTIAGMNVVRYTLRLAIRRGVKPIIHAPHEIDALPLLDGIYREVCMSEGKPEAYDRTNIYFFGTDWRAYSGSSVRNVALEKPGLLVIVGALGGTTNAPEAGQAKYQGAITLLGTPRWAVAQFTALYSDIPILGDDTFFLSAVCSGDPQVAAPMVGGDIVKLVSAVALLVLLALGLAGQPVIKWLAT